MGSKTILVAEAEQYILDLLDFNLKQTGFDVVIAMNGAEAMAAVASHFPSLILLDRQLPVIDGDEVCRRIKEYKATRPSTIGFSLADHWKLKRRLRLWHTLMERNW